MQISMPFWWSLIVLFALGFGLAGCDSPSMAFRNVPAERVKVAGSTFSVRHTRYEAEAIRINFEPGARCRAIVIKGVEAIERVSRCPVVVETVRGDANLVASDLNCAGVPERAKLYRPTYLDCTGYEIGGFAGDHLEIDCEVSR